MEKPQGKNPRENSDNISGAIHSEGMWRNMVEIWKGMNGTIFEGIY